MMRLKYSRGFTLVELMVTIAVMAIIAMMAVPSFSRMITNQKLKQSMIEMKLNLQNARSRAILTRSDTIVCPDTISIDDCENNITDYSSLTSSQKKDSVILVKIENKVTIKSGSATSFVFNSLGKTTKQDITLCGDNMSYKIDIEIPGVMTVTEGGGCS